MSSTLLSPGIPRLLACVAAACCSLGVDAAVTATDAWVRATVPAQKTTGAFLTLQSTDDAKLVGVATPVANSAEIHESGMSAGTMRMHAVDSVALPAGRRVELKPGGYHVMLLGIAKPLGAGDKVPLTLTIEGPGGRRSTVDVVAEVRPLGR
ncbi:MAG: copper chaperone PCu(A)C [Usitatibacter sp.]